MQGCGLTVGTPIWAISNDTSSARGVHTTYSMSIPFPKPFPTVQPCTISIVTTTSCTTATCFPPSSTMAYTLSVTRLSNPAHARLASVQLYLSDAVQPRVLCAHPSVLQEVRTRRAGASPSSAFPLGGESTVALLLQGALPPECDPDRVPLAVVSGVGSSVIRVVAAPMFAHVAGTQVSIGQRTYQTGAFREHSSGSEESTCTLTPAVVTLT